MIRTGQRLPLHHAELHADVVIVGGGLAGIACAVGLRDSGLQVLLLEETGSLGGRSRSWTDQRSGDVIDIGPHVLLSEDANLRALLRQLGTHQHIAWQNDGLPRLIGDGAADAIAARGALHRNAGSGLLPGLRDQLSCSALLWMAMLLVEADIEQLDELSAIELLHHHRVAPRSIRRFWASICLSLLKTPLEQCSAGALMRVYAQWLGHRRCRIGLARCALGELYVPAALRMIASAGGRVHLHARVVALIYCDGRAQGVMLEDGTRVSARSCVMAIPPQALARLLPARCQARPPFSDTGAFKPSPHVSVYLWLDRKLSCEKFWTCAPAGEALNREFHDLSNIRTDWHQRCSVIASNIVDSVRTEAMSDEEIIATTMRELAQATPVAQRSKILHAIVNRIPMAIPCPAPGTECKRPDVLTSIPGLLLAGDWTRTQLPACMEGAVRSGWLAAEQVLSARGRPRQLALPTRPPEGLVGLVHRYGVRMRRGRGPSPLPEPAA